MWQSTALTQPLFTRARFYFTPARSSLPECGAFTYCIIREDTGELFYPRVWEVKSDDGGVSLYMEGLPVSRSPLVTGSPWKIKIKADYALGSLSTTSETASLTITDPCLHTVINNQDIPDFTITVGADRAETHTFDQFTDTVS